MQNAISLAVEIAYHVIFPGLSDLRTYDVSNAFSFCSTQKLNLSSQAFCIYVAWKKHFICNLCEVFILKFSDHRQHALASVRCSSSENTAQLCVDTNWQKLHSQLKLTMMMLHKFWCCTVQQLQTNKYLITTFIKHIQYF